MKINEIISMETPIVAFVMIFVPASLTPSKTIVTACIAELLKMNVFTSVEK